MDNKVMMIIPSYVNMFKCIGGECEDNCCIGWDIDIDKLTFRKLHKVQEEPFKKMFQKSININNECTNEALDYGRIKLNKEKRCPFLKKIITAKFRNILELIIYQVYVHSFQEC